MKDVVLVLYGAGGDGAGDGAGDGRTAADIPSFTADIGPGLDPIQWRIPLVCTLRPTPRAAAAAVHRLGLKTQL